MANPTTPNADQKSAIAASAPDAKSVNVPDASDNKVANRTDDRADQGTAPKVDLEQTTGKNYAEQQKENARQFEKNVGEDSFRKAARLQREQEQKASEGDPTRDPVAKQEAMNMNTPNAAALRDAKKIKNIGEREAEKQAKQAGSA